MNPEETVIWVAPGHKAGMLATTTVMAIGSLCVWFSLDPIPNSPDFAMCDFTMYILGRVFLLAFFAISLCYFVYSILLIASPKPTLIIDSTGMSRQFGATKVPWCEVDVIERVLIPTRSTTDAIAIRFVENSDSKSKEPSSWYDWDRKEKYDWVVEEGHCHIPLDTLERKLLDLWDKRDC